MKKKILFITVSNLTTNPRLYKELILARRNGYEVEFIGFDIGGWSAPIEKNEVKKLSINNTYLSAKRKPFMPWLLASVIQRGMQFVYFFSKKYNIVNCFASEKRSFLLYMHLKEKKENYHLIIAHNLGALYPAIIYAQKAGVPCAFDIEDYHPGEKVVNCNEKREQERRKFIFKKLLPLCSYISYASPLIGSYSLDLLPKPVPNHFLINNSFFKDEFDFTSNDTAKVQFVWFSQNIDFGRGLEYIIPLLNHFKNRVHLNLIGNIYSNFRDYIENQYPDIITHIPAMPQSELHKVLSTFDIGLAIEQKSTDFNRTISITNKIIAYFQAGLFILATPTSAQKNFINSQNGSGKLLSDEKQTDISIISELIEGIDQIRKEKFKRFKDSQKICYENESKLLLQAWERIIYGHLSSID